MISHSHRCIFVHIPKTAGNSINRVFGVDWQDHKDLQRYCDELSGDVFSSYFKFAIVRNPWDRLLSDYNYQVKKGRARASKLFVFAADGSKRNFAEWAETALSAPDCYPPGDWGGEVSPHIHRWSPQIDWVSVGGQPRIDFVARLEHLPEDFRVIRHRLDLPPVRLPHRNRRLHWHYSHYYDRTTRELVAAYYARDIAEFDYEFEHALLRIAFCWPGAHRTNGDASETENSNAAEAADASGETCRVSFARPRTSPRRRAWQQPAFAFAASFVAMLVVAGAALFALDDAAAAPLTPVQQSVRRLLSHSDRPNDGLYARARRVTQAVSDLHLKFDLLSVAAPGMTIALTDDDVDVSNAGDANGQPAVVRTGSSPTPRWWIFRNRHRDPS